MVKILVDDTEIETEAGRNLLQVCLENDIYIPNLCYLEQRDHPHASCRMCWVEVKGRPEPVPSCTVQVEAGMGVRTDTEAVRRLQRSAFQLLMSVHHVDCANCPANKTCELQRIAKFLKIGLRPGPLERHLKAISLDRTHPFIDYYPNRCVLCGKCVFLCKENHGQSMMSFAKRGFETIISFFGRTDSGTPECTQCRDCITICPVGAIQLRDNMTEADGTR